MCLSIAVRFPDHVLSRGEHMGFQWMVTHNGRGYRCGYVRVPPGHPWHGKGYDDVDCAVHGGLTFSEKDEPCGKGGPDDAWWHGFDCAHGGDLPDQELPAHAGYEVLREIMNEILGDRSDRGLSVKSQEYVEEQCKSLCEQAYVAAKAFEKEGPIAS